MLDLRSQHLQEPGTYGLWGSSIDENSNPQRTAFDKLFEETGYDGNIRLEPLSVFPTSDSGFSHHNFLAIVDAEYVPWERPESDGYCWFEFGDWPQPMHCGVDTILADPATMDKVTDFVRCSKAGEDLISGTSPVERTLYHCLYKESEGDALNPTCLRDVNGRKENFLFAASYFTKALAFAFSYHSEKGEIICNAGVDGSPDEFAIICNRLETLNTPRHIRVCSFSSSHFEKAWASSSRQYVLNQPVSFKEAQLVFETQNIDDLMRRGLQIFSTNKTREELIAENFLENRGSSASSNNEWLRKLGHDEGFIWENHERNINPNSLLTKLFIEHPASYQKEKYPVNYPSL